MLSNQFSFQNLKTLAFHKMQASFSYGVNNYSPNRFEKLLKYLVEDGYHFVSIDEIEGELQMKSVLLTFDDAYGHLYEHLPRFIDSYDIKPLIFIPTNYIGKSNSWDYSHSFQNCPHMDIAIIKELSRLGVDFGSHSHTHADLTSLSLAQHVLELKQSKVIIEDIINKKIDSICYPFGRFNDSVIAIANDFGYKYGFTMRFPHKSDSSLTIGRFPIYGFDTLSNICQKMEHGMFYHCERFKSIISSKLSGGTILLKKLKK